MQLKTQTLQGEYDHVYSGDPALDQDVADWRASYERAIETSDPAALPLKPGATPAVWRLRHLSRGERCKVLDLHHAEGPMTATNAAVLLALVGARDAHDREGRDFDFGRSGRVGRFPALSETALDRIVAAVGDELIVTELAGRVMETFSPRGG